VIVAVDAAALHPTVAGFGEKDAVAPGGRPVTAKFTVWVAPVKIHAKIPNCVEAPAPTTAEVGVVSPTENVFAPVKFNVYVRVAPAVRVCNADEVIPVNVAPNGPAWV
jgi:hypothetical protein